MKATIDTIRYTITEASIRDSLLLEDAAGITMLPNDDLFEGMGQIGYPTDGTIPLLFGKQDEVFNVSLFSATDFGYSNGKQTPLSGYDPDQKGQEHHVVAQSQPSSSTLPVPSTSSPPVKSTPPTSTPTPTHIPASIPTPTPIPASIPTPTPIPTSIPTP
ncbi:hypothetical protein Tco_0177223, partial [Tanacetum coccineum]